MRTFWQSRPGIRIDSTAVRQRRASEMTEERLIVFNQ